MSSVESRIALPLVQEQRFLNPDLGIEEDFRRIYTLNNYHVGLSENHEGIYSDTARKNTLAVVGIALGDEGKGRIVDNSIETLLANPTIEYVYVIRFQGGSNAGHTVEDDTGIKLALHQVPSSVMYPQALGIMDRGMAIHVEDLQTEVSYVEDATRSLKGRLFLATDAIHITDLERAEEALNNELTEQSKGGTGRGIAPAYAHNLDRRGKKIADLLDASWEEIFSKKYDDYEKVFTTHGKQLSDVLVPDFRKTVRTGKSRTRTVGDKEQFLKRLAKARSWLLKRDMAQNTFLLHRDVFLDPAAGVVFEGSQAAGLDPWLGTRPDTTSSNTRVSGIEEGTGFWKRRNVDQAVGIMKVPYTSSVGARRMPTHIDLPRDLRDLPADATTDQRWAATVREDAGEYGTTTGRPRDINFLDLAFISFNARAADIDMIAVTHLDIAREEDTIKICTHYTDKDGNLVPYQSGLQYQKDVVPQYVEVPGWDGEACQNATTLAELPENAVKFLAFLQARIGYPIVAATTGPRRSNFIEF